MSDDEIDSPPYPGDGATVDILYKALGDLRGWVQRGRAATPGGRRHVPAPPRLPARSVYGNQPVADLFAHFRFLQQLRCSWDRVVRTFEDAWDCTACVGHRLAILAAAADLLGQAGVPYEHREARAAAERARFTRQFDRLQEMLFGSVQADVEGDDGPRDEGGGGDEEED